MKKIYSILAGLLLTASVFAQAPQKMSYQAVIRNSSNALITSTPVGMKISVLQGTSTGTAVYVETQTPSTNANGLVSLEIGSGTPVTGTFAGINWANGPYFIKTETDPTGGTAYTIAGTNELMSVPYALHAKTADNGISTAQANAITANTAKVGITTQQASDITANNAKVGITTAQANAIIANTAKVGVTNGTVAGQMQYWNGTAWVVVATTSNEGAALQMIGGVPTWIGGTPPPPSATNPTTSKVWMDRNLGATRVANSSTDDQSYGDLYQWGRGADGHQLRTTTTTTTTLSSSDNPGHGNFIVAPSVDWRSPNNNNLWQGVNGVNNPCPNGFRLPTEAEWDAERLSWISNNNSAGAFASPLKLPLAGYRQDTNGLFLSDDIEGYYWSSSVSSTLSPSLYFTSSNATIYNGRRAFGFSVRCIKQ